MTTRPHLLVLLVIAVFAGLISRQCYAGTQNATVTGTVYHSGAVVPGATVRLINANIGFSQVQTTDSDGTYTFSNVPPAPNYLISAEKSGFSTRVLTDITVQVGDEKLVLPPFLLEASTPSGQQVTAPQAARATATDSSISVDLISTTESGLLDTVWVHTLPLVNRDFIDLALLVPGTYPVEQGSILQGASLVVNGARADMNNFLLDGADNNDYTINQSLPFQIVEALQEFRVQASTSNAEFGRSGGAQVNSVSRSGSNGVHGTLFAFNRNSGLAAGNFFSAYSGGTFDHYARQLQIIGDGNPLADPTLAPLYDQHKPRVNQNQFGGNVGGPLMKDKLFGFFNWESFRLENPRPVFEQVPGVPLRSASSCASFIQQSFPTLPPGPCDPNAVALFNLYPTPNVPSTAFTNENSFLTSGSGAFNIGQTPNFTNTDNFLGRVDLRLGSRASMSFKHNIQRINQLQGGDVPASANYPGNGTGVNGRNQNFSYNFVELLTPRTTNEFRFGWNRFRLTTAAQDNALSPSTLGFQNLNSDNQGVPSVSVGGIFTTAQFSSPGSNFITPSNRADNVWSFADNVSLNRGRHTWKFGGEFRYIRLNVDNDAFGRGLITLFSAPQAAYFGTSDVASIGRVCPPTLPSFATVFSSSCSQFGSGFERHFATRSFNGYLQDQWRPRNNLTFNYGIRYEVNTAPIERQNLLVNFYPTLATADGAGGLVRAGSTTIFDPFGNVVGTAPRAAPRAGFDTDYNNWGPRFGFAWNPMNDGKTVIRGSYALVFDQQSLQPSVNMLLNPPFVQQDLGFFPFPALRDTFSACGPAFIRSNGCQTLSSNPKSASLWVLSPYSVTAVDPENRTPYVHQYHVGVQQRLGSNAVIEVAYVGSAGHRLPMSRSIDQCPTPTDPDACLATNPSGGFVHPFLVPTIVDQVNGANSNFNSLQVRLEARTFHRLQLSGFYQFAKSIDDSSSLQPQIFLTSPPFASVVVAATSDNPDNFAGANNISPTLSLQGNLPVITTRPKLPQDSSNLAGERGRSDFDIKHRFVLDYVYAVPTFAPVIGSGWQLAGITTVQSGQPFSVYADFFGESLRPNLVGAVPISANPQHAIDDGIPAGFSGSAFSFAPTFDLQPGSLGRNTFTGPKLINFDFAFIKDTRVSKREGTNLQFRVEFFNLFNNVNFRQPYSRSGLFFSDESPNFAASFPGLCALNSSARATCFLPDPFFGQILQAFPARQIQLALKFSF
jgi:Carboxypeptidase regulatory-like domain